MLTFAPAKINIGLYVTQKREDGFHDIETVFYPLPLYDVIEIVPSPEFRLFEYGIQSECSPENNLCFKAWKMLHNDYAIPYVTIYLLKNIPVQAGLGGGSSDAVGVLKLLNTMFDLNITCEKMFDYALMLGSDCPFFVNPKPAYAISRGEQLQTIEISLSGKTVFLFKPPFGISTKSAFEEISVSRHGQLLGDVSATVNSWKNSIGNVFQNYFIKHYPEIQTVIDSIIAAGAEYVSLTGTGSAFYAVFPQKEIKIPMLPGIIWTKSLNIE
jgi:4-diphosphocytidyl-2-C-methyl-D-erythritol kinase